MIPDPLHPAVAHFPIVLLLAGVVLAVWLVIRPGRSMALAAAVVMSLAAVSSQFAVMTGESDEEAGERASEAVFEDHEEAAETTRTLAFVTALAGIGAWAVIRRGKLMRPAAAVATVLALASAGMVARTGHLGGKLVYQHGAGVSTGGKIGLSERSSRHHDDDD